MNDDILIGKRIKQLRKALKLTQGTFAGHINRSPSMIYKIEKGEVELSPLISRAICQAFKIMKEWLYTGEGPMFQPEDVTRGAGVADLADLVKERDQAYAAVKALELRENLRYRFERILEEGDPRKIEAIRALVEALIPKTDG